MPELTKPQYERFAIGIAKGLQPAQAYVDAGYKGKGAAASAARLLTDAKIRARIAEVQATITAAVIKTEIAERDWRVMQLHDITHRLFRIRDARAKDPAIAKVPGGDTGFVQITHRVVKIDPQVVTKPDGQKEVVPGGQKLITEHAVDTGMIRELRATLHDAAEELGQLTQKHEHTGPGGGPVQIQALSAETLQQIAEELEKQKQASA